MKKTVILAGALALTLTTALAGCGRMADLEAPAPRETERAQRDRWAPKLEDPARGCKL